MNAPASVAPVALAAALLAGAGFVVSLLLLKPPKVPGKATP